jgi:hypothetical protein
VGGADVFDGGGLGDAEHAHEVDRIGGVVGFVEDAVDAELAGLISKGTNRFLMP